MGLSWSETNLDPKDVRSSTAGDEIDTPGEESGDGKGLVDLERLSERKGQIAVNSRYILTRSIEEDYQIQERVLGTGASGPVRLATDKDGINYAVKSFKV
mmetsp:Transcript_132067/g.254212  ORF Transcript_132067/g.254212 Transcript_132067/m.254212 type:complete len:100 (+) Transcript_132067:107-406(+)